MSFVEIHTSSSEKSEIGAGDRRSGSPCSGAIFAAMCCPDSLIIAVQMRNPFRHRSTVHPSDLVRSADDMRAWGLLAYGTV